ncbi:MAG: AAA family ATPase, partial [Corallococcus sp.]|nr:AAA family ATPase [Corallococcus sp.]
LNSRLANIEQQERELTERLSNLSGEEGNLFERYDNNVKLQEQLTETCGKLKKSVKELEFDIFNFNKNVQKQQQNVASEQGSIDLLLDFVKNYKGYQSSVQNLMKDAQSDEELESHLCDVVANVIQVDKEYQTAIEVALGARIQNVITETIEDTKYLIAYLRDNMYGRVTFLPIDAMKPRSIERREVLLEDGVLGIAKDIVQFDSKYKTVFDSILGGIVVIDTYENAVRLAKKYGYVHRMVTLTGERISNDGSVEGGSRKSATNNLLSYDNQLAERKAKLEKLLAALAESEKQLQSKQDKLDSERALLQKSTAELQNVSVAVATDKEKIETSNVLSNTDKQTILSLGAEKEKIKNRLEQIKTNGQESVVKLSELQNIEDKLVAKISTLKEKLSVETKARDAMQEVLTSKRYRVGVLKSNIDQSNADIKNAGLEIVRLEDAVKSKTDYKNQLTESLHILSETLANSGVHDEKRERLSETLAQINSIDTLKEDLNNKFQIAGDERIRLSSELENLRGVIDKEEYILNKIDDDLQELQQRVFEEYNITYSAAMQFKDSEYDISTAKENITQLKTSIQNLGYVNVHAIEELKNVEERYGDIGMQLEDLRKAEQDLKDILKELTAEIETRFETGMTQINDNFKVVFRELFNGGNAKLTLDKDENKDPLDYGIEIEAQPPGKKLQNISLLSGGERTLTAAAILFAILKLNPMPFCVLDEIEAALDDANAERIARYLRNFSNDTQFIIITHKKPTMENADVLYGVTMEEKGVSKIVSVKLNDAIKQAQ